MTDQELDPAVAKLLEYAKEKKELTWDELNELLPAEILNSNKMDSVLVLLEKNNIQIQDEEDAVADSDSVSDAE